MPTRYAAVLLDALGTLVQLDPPAPRLQAELRERLGVEVSLAQAEGAMAAEIRHYREHFDLGCDSSGLATLRASCAEAMSVELEHGLGRGLPDLAVMTEVLLASLHFSVFPEVPGVLRELRALGLRTVVVSNWDVSLPEVLGRLGLSPLLDGVITSAEVGARKPDRAVFEQALARAGAPGAQAVHVGDSLREDVEGARAAGIEPVLIRRGERPAQEADPRCVVIRSLQELPCLVSTTHG